MFIVEDDKKIGLYLSELITQKFKSGRQFCKAYIELTGVEADDVSIQKMANRLSQIKNGNKSIQLKDLQYFTQLLDVTCEQILSAGNYFVPDNGRVTNYQISFTKDEHLWEQYIHRDDDLILNADEYNKTVIDYALEFKNYDFLKYLMDNNYIWFDSDNKEDYAFSFGAGTSIERKKPYETDILNSRLATRDQLRRQMISLAIENEDWDMLTKLRAREIPPLYLTNYWPSNPEEFDDYYDENLIMHITTSNKSVLDYFSEEFTIISKFNHENHYMFPYISNLLEQLIKKKHSYTEIILNRCITHNQNAYTKINKLISKTIKYYEKEYPHYPKDMILKMSLEYFYFHNNGFIISIYDPVSRDTVITNIISINAQSQNADVNRLIDTLNASYNQIINMRPRKG